MDLKARQGSILLLLQAGLIFQACVPTALGHGFLHGPAARQFQAYNPKEINYEPFSNNGGGSVVVSRNSQLTWPEGVHSICGDRNGQTKWMQPRDIQATYTAGQTISTQVLIWNHHGGRYGFNVCPKGATKQSQCTPLLRGDGKSRWFYPPLPPNDPTLSRLWSVFGPSLQVGTETNGAFTHFRVPERADGMNQFKGTPVYVTQWRLPEDMTCEGGCILQWYWLTGNSCWPACDLADPLYPNCRSRCTRPNCICGEDKGTAYPEEFWNCADIRILPAAAQNKARRRPGQAPAHVPRSKAPSNLSGKSIPKPAPVKTPAKKPTPAKQAAAKKAAAQRAAAKKAAAKKAGRGNKKG